MFCLTGYIWNSACSNYVLVAGIVTIFAVTYLLACLAFNLSMYWAIPVSWTLWSDVQRRLIGAPSHVLCLQEHFPLMVIFVCWTTRNKLWMLSPTQWIWNLSLYTKACHSSLEGSIQLEWQVAVPFIFFLLFVMLNWHMIESSPYVSCIRFGIIEINPQL